MSDASADPPPPPPPPPTPAPVDRLAAELRASVGALVRATRAANRLAPIPAAVLALLDVHGAMTTADLAARRGVRHQTMAASVKDLMDAGLLAARPDPSDARKKLLTLTAEGKDALDRDRREREGVLARALAAALGEEERLVLAEALTLMDRITATITGAAPSAGIVPMPIAGAW